MNRKVLVLYELSRRFENGVDHILLSSSDAGRLLGISQQSACRYINELERDGLIKKTRSGQKQRIEITENGINLLREIYLDLKNFFEYKYKYKQKLSMEGRIITGIGDGAYYIKEYAEKLKERIGINPFYGTLNVKIDRMPFKIEKYSIGVIEEFREKNRIFGRIRYIPATISGDGWSEDCFIVLPERAHHKDEVEIISEKNLRREFGLKDGDKIRVDILL